MIAKAVKGKGFRGALEYDLNQEKGHLIDSNMSGETARELAAEFGTIRALRPNLSKAVLHVSLSAAPGEKLTDEQWRKIGKHYIDGMGLENNQFIVTRHTDTEHEHIHILANRIRFDGGVTSDSHDYKRQEVIMRALERDYSLERVAPSIEAKCKAPTKGEIEHEIRTGQPSAKQQLQQLCDAAANGCKSFTAYQARLEAVGVELVPVAQLEGAKLSGLSYRLDGVTMKGSDLGKGYSPAGLAKRGITYEQDRDFAGVRASVERETVRAFGVPDRDNTADQAPGRRGLGRDDRAIGASDGRAGGRDTEDADRDRQQEPGAGRELQKPGQRSSREIESGDIESGKRGRGLEQSIKADGVESLRPSPPCRDGYSASRERILALAGPSQDDGAEQSRSKNSRRLPEKRPDRSREAIQKQITALDVPRFEVGIREAKTRQMMNREWSREELEQSIPWLKRMNAQGNDIYIRPSGEHGFVLVDDLTADKISSMSKDVFLSAATIETSPSNYQAWVKLSDKPLSASIRQIAARELAKQYGGDMNSADSRHYGRLAGFTNQKPEHTHDGRQPYVLAHDCPGNTATASPELLSRVEAALDKAVVENEQKTRLEAIKAVSVNYKTSDPVREYQRQAQRLMARYGDTVDLSRMDWMIATDMAKSGNWTQQDIEKGISKASPAIESRKAGHIEDYARRTVEKAWTAPEVQQKRQEHQAQRGRDGHGMSR